MRRATRTETGTGSGTGTGPRAQPTGKRWTVPGLVGVAGGAAAVGFGGLYAAGLLWAGEDTAPGTKVRGDSVTCSA